MMKDGFGNLGLGETNGFSYQIKQIYHFNMHNWDIKTDPVLQRICDSIEITPIVWTPEMEEHYADQDLQRWCKEYEQQHKREVKDKVRSFVDSFPTRERQSYRKQYLLNRIEKLGEEIDAAVTASERITRTEEAWFKEYILRDTNKKMKLIKRHYREIDSFRRRKKAKAWVGEDEIQTAKDADMVELGLIEGKLKGNKYWLECPFHQEKTASCVLFKGGKGFYCYGCNEGGDNIRFIMKTESLPFNKAVKFINGN